MTEAADSGGMGGADFDATAVMAQLQRLARLDTTVFDEVRSAESQTIPAVVVSAVSILLGSLGAYLWLIVDNPFGGFDLDHVQAILRVLLLGTAVTFAMWVAWALITQVVLLNLYNVTADRMALLRCIGFATAPAAVMLLVAIPSLSFGIGLVAIVAWFVLTNYAIQAAAPNAAPNQVVISNLAGFLVFAVVLALLADAAALASGVFVHVADISEYIDIPRSIFG